MIFILLSIGEILNLKFFNWDAKFFPNLPFREVDVLIYADLVWE